MSVDRPAAIRRALRDLVAERGFHGASMGAVAKAARVATGTAYVHYESKEGAVHALATHHRPRPAEGGPRREEEQGGIESSEPVPALAPPARRTPRPRPAYPGPRRVQRVTRRPSAPSAVVVVPTSRGVHRSIIEPSAHPATRPTSRPPAAPPTVSTVCTAESYPPEQLGP